MVKRRRSSSRRKVYRKKATCKKGKPKYTVCYKVKGGYSRRRVKK